MKFLKLVPIVAAAALLVPIASANAQQWGGSWNNGYYSNGGNGGGPEWNSGWNRNRQGWNGGWNYNGWNSRNVSDPSYRNRAARRTARHLGGGCAEDLGYGRYEICD